MTINLENLSNQNINIKIKKDPPKSDEFLKNNTHHFVSAITFGKNSPPIVNKPMVFNVTQDGEIIEKPEITEKK